MIEIAQGTPGSGKSAVAVARAILHLKRGGVVAANFALTEGWALIVAASMLRVRLFAWLFPNMLNDLALSLHRRFYIVDSVHAINQIFPKKEAVWLYRDKGKYSEGEGLLILDEAQLCFNARKWEKNFPWIEFFTQHRKKGWDVILIAHSIDMIDAQIRPLCELESRFRNLQKVKIPFTPISMSPFFPMFLVITRYCGLGAGSGVVHSRGLFPLPLWAARLYDSLAVFSADQWGETTDAKHCGLPPASGDLVLDRPRLSRSVPCAWDSYNVSILSPVKPLSYSSTRF